MRVRSSSRAALGLTIKSGWAACVLVTGSTASPRLSDSRRIDLSDPEIPESRQPYHDGFATARTSGQELSRLLDSVRMFGTRSVSDLIRQYQEGGRTLIGVGLVVGSLADPDGIANEHIRIHAREGQLFRSVAEQAASRSKLPCSIWRERDLYAAAAAALRMPEQLVRDAVAALRPAGKGAWRAEQKTAAAAAWLVLAAAASQRRQTA